MERRNLEYIEMFEHVVKFRATHVDLFPAGSVAAQSFDELGAAVAKVSDQAASQVSRKNGGRGKTAVRVAARATLQQQLQRISDTALAISIDTPGFADSFRMPEQRSDKAMILAGKSFANEAVPVKEKFVRHHLQADFIEKLHIAAADLEQAMLEQAATNSKGVSATRSIEDTVDLCHRLLQRLDAIVVNILADDSALTAEWENTWRVGHTAARSAAAAAAPAAS